MNATVDSDLRLGKLKNWLCTQTGTTGFTLTPVSGDASFRRYFRMDRNGQTSIAVDAPPEHEDNYRFVRVTHVLKQHGAIVPEIYRQDLELGFLLLQDFGDCLLLKELNNSTVKHFYQKCLQALLNIQKIPVVNLPAYDHALLLQEMRLFYDWYLLKHLRIEPTSHLDMILDETFASLAASALEQPRVFVHRDYHSRNIMVLKNGDLGIIDYQDAVYGPVSYDLVSLLRDCYIEWPDPQVYQWVENHRQQLLAAGLLSNEITPRLFTHWFDLMGMQRHLKAIGIFSRLHHRDSKSNYLPEIPRTLSYVVRIAKKYPQYQALLNFLDRHITLDLRA